MVELIICLVALAGANSILGVYLLQQKKMMLIDAIAHGVLPGIAVAYLWTGSKTSMVMLLFASALGTALMELMSGMKRKGRVREDSGIGLVYTSMFALGIVIIAYFLPSSDLDQDCVLSGDIALLYFQPRMLLMGINFTVATWMALLLLASVLCFVFLFKESLKLYSYDSAYAASKGLNVRVFQWLFHFVLSWCVVISFDMLGSILVVGLVAIPASISFLWSNHWRMQFVITASVVFLSVTVSVLLISYYNFNLGHLLVVVNGAIFLYSFLFVVIVKKLKQRWNKKLNFVE